MKIAVSLIVILGVVVCSTAQTEVCPAGLGDQVEKERAVTEEAIAMDQKEDEFKIGDEELLSMVKEASYKSGLGEVFNYMAKEHEQGKTAEPMFDHYLSQSCKEEKHCLRRIWHNGEMCYIPFPHWQRVYTVRCYYEPCCDKNSMKTCIPTTYRTYNILIYCPRSQWFGFTHRCFPTKCECRCWWCSGGPKLSYTMD